MAGAFLYESLSKKTVTFGATINRLLRTRHMYSNERMYLY